MTVKTRLMLLMGTAIAGIVILLGLLIRDISSVYKAANFANTNTVPSIQLLGEADRNLANVRVWTWKLLATTDAATATRIETDIGVAHDALVKALNDYQKSFVDDSQDAADLAADKEALAAYDTGRTHVIELARAGKKDEALTLFLSSQPAINKVVDAIEAHKKYNTDLGVINSKDAAATRTHAMIISPSVGLLLLVALVITGMRTTRTLLGTLGGEPADVATIARDVASGNLSSTVNLQHGDTTSLLATVAQMQTDLKARAERERAAAP